MLRIQIREKKAQTQRGARFFNFLAPLCVVSEDITRKLHLEFLAACNTYKTGVM
jgi:hypothetical protein